MALARIAVDVEIGVSEASLTFDVYFDAEDFVGLTEHEIQESLESIAYDEIRNQITITPRLVDIEE